DAFEVMSTGQPSAAADYSCPNTSVIDTVVGEDEGPLLEHPLEDLNGLMVRRTISRWIWIVQDRFELILAGSCVHQLRRLLQVDLEVFCVFSELLTLGIEEEFGLADADKRVPKQLRVDSFLSHTFDIP